MCVYTYLLSPPHPNTFSSVWLGSHFQLTNHSLRSLKDWDRLNSHMLHFCQISESDLHCAGTCFSLPSHVSTVSQCSTLSTTLIRLGFDTCFNIPFKGLSSLFLHLNRIVLSCEGKVSFFIYLALMQHCVKCKKCKKCN